MRLIWLSENKRGQKESGRYAILAAALGRALMGLIRMAQLGKIYDVLTIAFGTQQKWLLRSVGDGLNGVALFPLEQFEEDC